MHMVDVSGKDRTVRVAVARGSVKTEPQVVARIASGEIPKGDVLAAARLAAIIAVKKTPDIVPLCHPISIGGVEVDLRVRESGFIDIEVTVRTTDRTGVEMEALTGVCAAGLTIIDMTKGIDPASSIEGVWVVSKSGGKTGDWFRAGCGELES
jgi:cyclic pyranopterin phosphate synthase